jgi:hypothetical protein
MSSKHDREPPGMPGEDAAVSHAWRQASDEEPSARLDVAILAAAQESVQGEDTGAKTLPLRPQARSRWMQWQPLAAAATVAGLAFVLVQTLPRDRQVAPPIRMEAPVSAPAPAAAPAPAPDAAPELRSSAAVREVTEAPESPAADHAERERNAESSARAPKAEVDAGVAATMRDAEADQHKGVMTQAPGEVNSAESVAPGAARAPRAQAAPSAADWAARIEALHASGDLADAADALRAFRATDPQADSLLPEPLREWARTVD